MSGVYVIRTLLVAAGDVTAIVGSRIRAGVDLPLGTDAPALLLQSISSVPLNFIRTAARMVHTERVQVSVIGGSYPQIKHLLRLIRVACVNAHGVIGGVDVIDVITDVESPEGRDEPTGLMTQSRDFIVRWAG